MTEMSILAGRLQQRVGEGQYDRIFIRDLILDCHIGVYEEEQGITQKVGFRRPGGTTGTTRPLRR